MTQGIYRSYMIDWATKGAQVPKPGLVMNNCDKRFCEANVPNFSCSTYNGKILRPGFISGPPPKSRLFAKNAETRI